MVETLSLSPEAIAEWIPFAKAAGFFLATFILEDVAAVGAGLMLASGTLSWPAAFTACFLGIWLGDVGLYGIARIGGRRWFEKSRFKKFAPKVAESERWFGQRGTLILIFSRVVPGARLPTYLAAGFLRTPLPGFLLVTGIASFLWTALILRLTELFGTKLLDWLDAYKHGGFVLLGVGIMLIVLLQLLRRAALNFEFRKIAQGLAGGSGWVMLGYNEALGILENHWMADHATAPAHTRPLLVLDMYEHAFHMDYGAAAARYIDAWFANLNWETVAARA